MKINKKELLVKCAISAFLACLTAFCIVWAISSFHYKQKISAAELQFNGYELQNGKLVIHGNDPHIEAPNLNCYMNTLKIYFKKPIHNKMSLTVYYAKNHKDYSESDKINIQVKQGTKVVSVPIRQEIEKLRMDLDETKQNSSFTLDHIEFRTYINDALTGMPGERFKVISVFLFFVFLFPLFGIRKTRDMLFSNRWKIALLLLLFAVVNKYNVSSIAAYTTWIQPTQGSEFCNPIFGQPRVIRSDEWMVDSGRILSAQYSNYGKINSLAMAKDNSNLSASYLQRGYSALATPEKWLYYLIKNPEYGFSFQWFFNLFVSFMCTWELFLILTNKNRIVSFAGTFLVIFSSYYQWWSWSSIIPWSSAFLVAVFYYFKVQKRYLKILFGIAAAISGARFVIILYPAYQVPMGYIILIIMLWIFWENKAKWKEFRKMDYAILICSVLFSVSLIGAYLYDIHDYIKTIGQTVYPGNRFSSKGGQEFLLSFYIQDLRYPYLLQHPAPATEASCFMSFYPLPIVGSIFFMIKNKKKNILVGALTIYACFLSWYVFFGLPKFIAKITMFSYSPSQRTSQMLGYVCVILLVLLMNKAQEEKLNRKFGFFVTTASILLAIGLTENHFPGYNSKIYFALVGLLFIFVGFALVSNVSKKIFHVAICIVLVISLIRGATVMPLMKGLDAIYSKPIAKEIQKIAKKDPKGIWIAIDESPDYLIANGAKTLNSTNFVPNISLWEKFQGTKGVLPSNYNRYAHLEITFTDKPSKLKVTNQDSLKFYLNYDDIKKTDIKYIETSRILENQENVAFKKIYDNEAIFIYEVQYKNTKNANKKHK